MPHVTPPLPNQGESADATDISVPLLELLAVFNGHIGADNLEPGTIPAALGTGSVTEAMIAALAITAAKIAEGAVTPQKVAPASVVTTGATITPVLTSRMTVVTALAENTTIAVPTGTPLEGQALIFRIKDNGTSRTLTWNAIYRAIGITIPTSTSVSKELYVSCLYNAVASKWDVVSVGRQG